MRNGMVLTLQRSSAIGLMLLVLAAPQLASAGEDDGQDLALSLHAHGQIHALADILDIVRRQTPGDVISVDLVPQGGRWLYRFQIIASGGLLKTVDVDAGAAVLVEGEGGD